MPEESVCFLGVYQRYEFDMGTKLTHGFIKKFENGTQGHEGRTRVLAYLGISKSARLFHRYLSHAYLDCARTRQKKGCVQGRMPIDSAKIMLTVAIK